MAHGWILSNLQIAITRHKINRKTKVGSFLSTMLQCLPSRWRVLMLPSALMASADGIRPIGRHASAHYALLQLSQHLLLAHRLQRVQNPHPRKMRWIRCDEFKEFRKDFRFRYFFANDRCFRKAHNLLRENGNKTILWNSLYKPLDKIRIQTTGKTRKTKIKI